MFCGDISDAGLRRTGPLPLDSGQTYAGLVSAFRGAAGPQFNG